MTNVEGRKPEGAPERSPQAGEGASGVDGNVAKRFSVQRKMAVVARMLRGEPLELVARETNVSIARLSEWRERALALRPIYSWPPEQAQPRVSKPGCSTLCCCAATPVLRCNSWAAMPVLRRNRALQDRFSRCGRDQATVSLMKRVMARDRQSWSVLTAPP